LRVIWAWTFICFFSLSTPSTLFIFSSISLGIAQQSTAARERIGRRVSGAIEWLVYYLASSSLSTFERQELAHESHKTQPSSAQHG
jgi:hypothetical protein